MISAGDVREISVVSRDYNGDGEVNEADFNAQVGTLADDASVIIYVDGKPFEGRWSDLKQQALSQFIANSSSNVMPSEEAEAQLGAVKDFVASLLDKYQREKATLEALPDNAPEAQRTEAQRRVAEARENLAAMVRRWQTLNVNAGKEPNTGIDASILRAAGIPEDGQGPKATVTYGAGGGAGTGAGAQTAGGSAAPGFTPPATWGTNPMGGMKAFSTDAYVQSVAMEDNILSSFDSVLKNQNQGKQLMMLFFYFARLAESGDLGAMYQFMKFLTVIISKDKSLQQTQMGKKLIELQDLSRQWTDKLLGMSTDSTDPNASTEFTKMMTQVKSETDAIATSQKLISQMMEEFAQIVETLTNATKGALEAEGRVLRTVSRFNG